MNCPRPTALWLGAGGCRAPTGPASPQPGTDPRALALAWTTSRLQCLSSPFVLPEIPPEADKSKIQEPSP